MAAEHPHWPNIELRRIANGWIVQQGMNHDRATYAQLHEVYCFTEWRDCERFMVLVSIPTRSSAGEQHGEG